MTRSKRAVPARRRLAAAGLAAVFLTAIPVTQTVRYALTPKS
ncbi:hypothetical protein [Kitasatospora aureofaciens]|nr:hypothetical protein [Kitasatospora aureofaciens]